MVNIPGRSRGCAVCRKRKVKCDQSFPQCRRCVDMGLRCPGARTEAFFVHAVSSSPSRPQSDAPNRNMIPSLQLPGPQPSRGSAFDQLFVSHFIESFFGPMKPPPPPDMPTKIWLHELPIFLATPEPSLAKYAIRAASMLSYGSQVDDISIKSEADRWYVKALQGLRCLLSYEKTSFPESVVCASVMLIHFETLAGTCQRAWLRHVKGAAMLLEAGGPERCRSGFMHQIFSHLRFQALIAALAENEVPAFASPEWMTIPYETHPKQIFDQLIDVLFAVDRCLSVATVLITATGDTTTDLTIKLDTHIRVAISHIHQWWSEGIPSGNYGEAEPTETRNYAPEACSLHNFDPPLLPYMNIPTAAIVSLYDVACIIVLRLLYLVSPSTASHDACVRRHAQAILSANWFINAATGPAPDRGSIIMVLQLKIASLWSSSSEQRNTAVEMLQGGKVQNGGLADVSTISHEYFADVAAYILQHYPSE